MTRTKKAKNASRIQAKASTTTPPVTARPQGLSTYGYLPLVLLCIVALLGIIALMFIASSRNQVGEASSRNTIGNATPSQTSTFNVRRGDVIQANILINGAQDFAGLQTDIVYDKNMLTFVRIAEGTVLGNGAPTIVLNTMNTSSPGIIKDYVIVRIGAGTSEGGTVASAYFTAKQRGKTTIKLSKTLLANSQGELIPATAATLAVQVQPQ